MVNVMSLTILKGVFMVIIDHGEFQIARKGTGAVAVPAMCGATVNTGCKEDKLSATAAKEKMSTRHLLVVLTGVMITFGCSALCFSTYGSFMKDVANALADGNTAQFGLYITAMYLTMTIISPFAGKLLQSVDVRILLSVSAALVGCAFLLMSLWTNIYLFMVSGVMLGIGEIFILWLAIPTLINNWFNERAGFFIGICMAFTGIGGAVWNGVYTYLTTGLGMHYNTVYMIWGIIALVTSLPFTLFCVRTRPEDCGLKPYGVAATAAAKPRGLDAKKAMKSPTFYAICLFAGLINVAILIAVQFKTYVLSLDGQVVYNVAVAGGIVLTVNMAAQAIAKVLIGTVADKSPRTALLFAFCCGIIGLLLCWFGFQTEYALYAGAAIFGGMYATAVVLVPIVVRHVFGTREYSVIYSRVSTVFNFISAFASLFYPAIYQGFGWSACFMVAIAMLVIVLVLGLYALGNAKKIQGEWTE